MYRVDQRKLLASELAVDADATLGRAEASELGNEFAGSRTQRNRTGEREVQWGPFAEGRERAPPIPRPGSCSRT
jgi:hypothetical protein